jgi:small conductance mechanosensitive channel
MVVGIGYGSDLLKAKAILEEMVNGHELVLKDPAPKIAVSELADSSVNFVVRPWVNAADYWTVKWDLTEKIKLRFDAEGIEIPFPQMSVHIEKTENAA